MYTLADEESAIKALPSSELRRIAESAIGRVFGMMQRKEMDGDVNEYKRCRAIAMSCCEELRSRGELV